MVTRFHPAWNTRARRKRTRTSKWISRRERASGWPTLSFWIFRPAANENPVHGAVLFHWRPAPAGGWPGLDQRVPRSPKIEMMVSRTKLRCAGGTHPGLIRSNNEDRFHCDPSRGILLVVDGIGGHAAGEKAADVAIS